MGLLTRTINKGLVLLRTTWGTFWELDGNTLGTRKYSNNPHPTPQKKNKNWVYWVHVAIPH